jgi:diguanylate cyclase (GGDEF)-like protein
MIFQLGTQALLGAKMESPKMGIEEQSNQPHHNSGAKRSRDRGKAVLEKVGRLDIQAGPLMAILEAPATDPDKVAIALEQSPALAARVLSVTNSAASGVVGEINDIRRAVLHMGASRSRSIAMAFALHMMADDAKLDPEVAHRLWVNSLEKANLASLITKQADPHQANTAYTLGLIQDVGLSALWAVDPEFYGSLDVGQLISKPLHQLEQEHFGIDHACVGHHLLTRWNASPILCEQVLEHHQLVLTQCDASVPDLANLIAGMLPHEGEPMTPDRMEWLAAVHGQFLSSGGDSIEELIRSAIQSAKEVHRSTPSTQIDADTWTRILGEISTDTDGMVRKLCEMETQLTQKHEQVNTLQFEAMTDPLTQILNRRGFDRLAERRVRTAVERGLPICAVVIDLDGFKQINDTYGHEAGDLMLIEVAKLLRGNIDSSDLIGRMGGDEFMILQININQEIARKILERVANACQHQMVQFGDGKQAEVAFSIGAATCEKPTTKTLISEMLSAADNAMYASKREGPGRITFTEFTTAQKKAS